MRNLSVCLSSCRTDLVGAQRIMCDQPGWGGSLHRSAVTTSAARATGSAVLSYCALLYTAPPLLTVPLQLVTWAAAQLAVTEAVCVIYNLVKCSALCPQMSSNVFSGL